MHPPIVDAWLVARDAGPARIKPIPSDHDGEGQYRVMTDAADFFVKLHKEGERAAIEQAGNFYLSRRHLFIVPTDTPEPFSHEGVHLTHQRYVPPRQATAQRYFLTSLAELHETPDQAFPEQLQFPRIEPPDFEQATDDILRHGNPRIQPGKLRRLRATYERALAFMHEDLRCLLHGDPKVQNRHGSYWVDLEHLAAGSSAWDVAFVLNDPLLHLTHAEQRAHLDVYLSGRIWTPDEYKRALRDAVPDVQVARCISSLRWNLTHATREGRTGEEKIAYLAHVFGLD